MLPLEQWEEKRFQMDRARKLYLRGAAILERGINNKYPGMLAAENDPFSKALAKMKKEDISLFYWYAAGTLSAYAVNVFDLSLGLKVPRLTAMMNRAYELDENYNSGALDEFFLILYGALPEGLGGDPDRALIHYRRALEKSKGLSAAPYVAYAQTMAVKNQDYESFKNNLETALAIDPAANPSNTLINTISQNKARYLLEKAPELFSDLEVWDYNDE
jgi:predicted anti-sigma-YlaC factor YlaD